MRMSLKNILLVGISIKYDRTTQPVFCVKHGIKLKNITSSKLLLGTIVYRFNVIYF